MDINLDNITARIKTTWRNEELIEIITDEMMEAHCEKLNCRGALLGENVPSEKMVVAILDAARMFPDAVRRIKQLKAQLPPEMQKCMILLKQCEKGHSWLTASNWADAGSRECPWCKMEELESRNTTTNHRYTDLQYQLDSAVAENEDLQRRIDAFIKIGGKPLEECHKTQNILRDRLDRINGRLMQVPYLKWKNGDGVDDVTIRYMNMQDAKIANLESRLKHLKKTEPDTSEVRYCLNCIDPEIKLALDRVMAYMESQRSIASPYYHWTDDVKTLQRLKAILK